MHVLAAEPLVRVAAALSDASFGGCGGISASQPPPIRSWRPACFDRACADLEVVLRLEELHQRPLHLAVAQLPGDVDRFLPVNGSMPV